MTVLAHQGGWDEIGFVLVPIALFALLLAVANRRASRAQAVQKMSTAIVARSRPASPSRRAR